YPPGAVPRVPGYETLHRPLAPPHPPAPDRPDTDAEPVACRRRTLEPCEVNHHQSLPDPPSVLKPDLHIAQFDHSTLLLGQLDCPSKQERSILSRYFTF